MKLIVINSFGPMGSTVVSSLIEHYGFLNLPLRKLGLNDYLVGTRDLNDDFLKKKLLNTLKNFNKPQKMGGISVLDRDNRLLDRKIKIDIIERELNKFFEKKFTSIKDMYFESFLLFNKALVYKSCNKNPLGVIELTTDIEKYQSQNLQKLYKREFKDVYFINIRRDFLSWLNSFVSQYYAYPKLKVRNFFFRLSNVKRNFKNYEKSLKEFENALNINFDEIFIPNNLNLKRRIEYFINVKSDFDLEKSNYDLYGGITDYKKTFTKHDDNYYFLPKIFHTLYKKIGNYYFKNILSDLILDFIFQLLYLFGYFKYKNNAKNTKKN